MAGRRDRGPVRSVRGAGRPVRAVANPLRALLALVVLVALCAGIPIALVGLTATSFPHGLLAPAQILSALTGRDDGALFFALLTAAAWVGWATFTLAVVLEVPARFRGVPAVRIRGLGFQQSVAGGLVAAALAVVLLPAAAGASERHAQSGTGAPAPARTSAPAPTRQDVARSPVADPPESVTNESALDAADYMVRHGDTLWDLAAEHLGDGTRWRQIAALNYERPQPDGAHLDHSHVLRPGWRLVLPAAPEAEAREADRVHVVRAGETLSGIARDQLGDAARYRDLLRATSLRTQPDGRHLTDPDIIYPGWTIEIPASGAENSEKDGPARAPGTPVDVPPSDSHRPPAPPAPPAPAAVRQTRSESLSADPADSLDPSWSQASAGRLQHSGRQSVPAAPPTYPGPVDQAGGSAVESLPDDPALRTAGGIGALLAAGLVVLLGARRARQQRRRGAGERIPLPARAALATEAKLRAVADPVGVAHVDLALRALAARYRSAGRPLPRLRSARLTATQLELYLTEPAPLPEPWVSGSDPTVWAMTHEDLGAQPETDLRAPFPCLVTVGHDLDGAHILLDLEQLTTLAVEGPLERTLPVLAALAVELATSPWADDLLVTLVGCLPQLPAAVATGRLRHVERIEQLINDLEGRARDVERVLAAADVDDLAVARGTGVADDAWSPEIVLLAGDVPESARARLETVLYRVPRVGLAAVTAGTALGEWRLHLTGPDAARLDPSGLTVRPQVLAGEEYEHVLEVLRVSDAEPVPGPSWGARVPRLEQVLADLPAPVTEAASEPIVSRGGESGAGETGDGAAASPTRQDDRDSSADVVRLPGHPPMVRLFGTVEVVGALGPEPVTLKDGRAVASHLGRATALVAYLACRPTGATIEQISEALSPVRRLAPSTVWSLASRTRKWLGSDPDGVPYFPRMSDAGSNRLHPAVRTDWSICLELVGDDVTRTPLTRVMEALDLVRGRPFEGAPERHFAWAEPLRQEMTAGVVDLAHEVVRRALLIPDTVMARRAASVGRAVDPANEVLWRDALRVEYVAGSRENRQRLVDQLYAMADDLEIDLEPETEQLIAELESPRQAKAVAR